MLGLRLCATALGALVSALLAGSVVAPAAADADVDKTGVRPVTIVTAPLVPGQSAWVSVVWTADQTVDDWSTTRDRAGSPALVAQLRTVSSAGCPAA